MREGGGEEKGGKERESERGRDERGHKLHVYVLEQESQTEIYKENMYHY